MALTVRLDPRIERALHALAKRKRLSRSDIVREAIVRYEASQAGGSDDGGAYGAWADVIGVVSLGVRDASRTTGDQFGQLVQDKRRARRPR